MTEKFGANIGLLQSRHVREWAKEDGIDENDVALERIAKALDRLRKGIGDNETREEYRAAQTAYRAECRAAMKAYREAHGKHSIRA
jgi:hypothetical protein